MSEGLGYFPIEGLIRADVVDVRQVSGCRKPYFGGGAPRRSRSTWVWVLSQRTAPDLAGFCWGRCGSVYWSPMRYVRFSSRNLLPDCILELSRQRSVGAPSWRRKSEQASGASLSVRMPYMFLSCGRTCRKKPGRMLPHLRPDNWQSMCPLQLFRGGEGG